MVFGELELESSVPLGAGAVQVIVAVDVFLEGGDVECVVVVVVFEV